jgi:hypothetical protein
MRLLTVLVVLAAVSCTSGIKGDTGATGSAGLVGPAGPAGPKGYQGETGAAGPAGDAGPPGPQGPKGDTGATGPQGPKGDTGAQGPKGLVGPIGGGIYTSVSQLYTPTALAVPGATALVYCDNGDLLLSGGCGGDCGATGYPCLKTSMPRVGPTQVADGGVEVRAGWYCEFDTSTPWDAGRSFAVALCVRNTNN